MIHIRVLFNLSEAKNNVAHYLIVCAAYYTSGYKIIFVRQQKHNRH
jgi:hypothetical protein